MAGQPSDATAGARASEGRLRITQVRSLIGRPAGQRATVRALGLKRIRHTIVQPDRPEIRGMLRKVPHLVAFEEVPSGQAEGPAGGAPPGPRRDEQRGTVP